MRRESFEVSEAKGARAREKGKKKLSGGESRRLTPGGTILDGHRVDVGRSKCFGGGFRRLSAKKTGKKPNERGARRRRARGGRGARRCTHQGGGEQGEEDAEAEDDTVTGRFGEDRDIEASSKHGGLRQLLTGAVQDADGPRT